jgi:hypothetical protein
VKFTAATSATIKSIAVDFCANSPIVGDSCTAPAAPFTVGGSPSVTIVGGITGWSSFASLNSGRTLTLTDATGTSLTGGSTVVEFDITGVTNTSTLGAFYGRILTFPNDSGANSAANYTAGTPGTYTDQGGIAMSTANQIDITAKVQETLIFCVYTTGSNCAGASGTAVAIGDANGVLANTSGNYQANSKFSLGSNALNGVKVRMKGDTLKSGANSITAQGTSCTADSSTSTVSQFGMKISSPGANTPATAPYDCTGSNHSLDISTACGSANDGNITCLYGQEIASTASATDEEESVLEWNAKAANATPAGIYTATMTFIATGTY